MQFTRIFTGTDGQSHFEDLNIPLSGCEVGNISTPVPVNQIFFGESDEQVAVSWHNPPCRQYVIMLEGEIEIEIGDGFRRVFKAGDILLAEDIDGQGHITRPANLKKRRYLAIPLR